MELKMIDQRVLKLLKVTQSDNKPGQSSVDYVKINQLLNINKYSHQISQDEEFQFVDDYEKNKSKQKMEQEQEAQKRRDRMCQKQEEIRQRAEEKKKEELKRLDEEYSQKLLEEEKRALERENQERQKVAEQEGMILQVYYKYQQFVDYDTAKVLLADSNWNIQSVMQQLDGQFSQQAKEEEKKEILILQMLQDYPNVDYDQAKNILTKHNWNYQSAIAEFRPATIRILFSMIGQNNAQIELLQRDFNLNQDGFQLLTFLNTARPLNNQYHRIFFDIYMTRELNFLQMSNPLQSLNLQPNTTLYVRRDAQPCPN